MRFLLELLAIAVRRMPWLIFVIASLSVLAALLEVSTLGLLPPLFALLSGASAENFGTPIREIIASFSGQSRTDVVLFFALALSGLAVIRFFIVSLNYWLIGEVDRRLVAHLRDGCLSTLFYAPQPFLDNYDNARIIQHLNEQSLRAGEAIRSALKGATPIVSFIFNVMLLAILSWSLTLASLGVLSVMATAIAFIPKAIGEYAKRYVQAVYKYNVKVMDLVGGIKTVRSFANFNKERVQTTLLLEQQIDAQKRKVFFSGITVPLFEMLGLFTLCGILVFSASLLEGDRWMLVLAPFIIILSRCIPQMSIINSLRSLASLNEADYRAVKAFIETAHQMSGGGEFLKEPFRRIELKDIVFRYKGRKETVIQDLNLTIRHGDWVLIMGPSGSGKSTILGLIAGLYECNSGQVLVNGIDIQKLDLQHWRRHIGVVEQAPFIFNGSIRENVAYRETDVSENDIWSALDAAGLETFVRQLPKGLETPMGDGGVQLSGGQRQRLAVARALAHRPDLLILDEPTSALDSETEIQVLKSLRTRFPEKTVVAVSHSEAMRDVFRCVYNLQQGRIYVENDSPSNRTSNPRI